MKLLTSLSLLAFTLTSMAQPIPRFTPFTGYTVPGASMAVLADVNGDGKLDIVTANGYAPDGQNPGAGGFGVSLLLGNGDGTFQSARTVLPDGSPIYVAVADFDGDGRPDLMVDDGPGNSTIQLLKGNGDGSFQTPQVITVSDAPMTGGFMLHGNGSLVVADFNHDKKPDLAISYMTETVVAGGAVLTPVAKVLLNNGDGTFRTSFTTNAPGVLNGIGMYAGDFNFDGTTDLLLYGAQRTLELGNGDGTFHEDLTSSYASISANTESVFADFNRDGVLDAASVFATPPRTALRYFVNLAMGGSDLSFQSDLPNFFPVLQSTNVAADFNGDGLMDFAGTNFVAYNLGNGFFQTAIGSLNFGSTNTTMSVNQTLPQQWYATGDLDRNGSPDLISTEDGRFVEVALNTGGNPPLLASFTSNHQAVVTGTVVTETVSVGSAAPSGGAVISLSSDSTSATVPASVTIPAGSVSTSFSVQTSTGANSSQATITASYRGIMLRNSLLVVPHYSLSSVSILPNTLVGMMGGHSAIGTITLTGQAADGTVINLSSSDPSALTVPSTVTVAPGATTVTFTVSAQMVSADTAIIVSATYQGLTKTSTVIVKKEIANITITKAEYAVNQKLLKVEGSTTSTAVRLDVYDKATGFLVGQVSVSRGRFTGQLFSREPHSITTILVQSSLGEAATSAVSQK